MPEALEQTQTSIPFASNTLDDLSMNLGYVSVTTQEDIPCASNQQSPPVTSEVLFPTKIDKDINLVSSATVAPVFNFSKTQCSYAETSNDSLVTIDPLIPGAAPDVQTTTSLPESVPPEITSMKTKEEVKTERKDSIVRYIYIVS